MAERIEPAETAVGLGADELIADYQAWCCDAGTSALAPEAFISYFDEARHEHRLADHIGKFGRRYYGIRVVTKKVEKLAGKSKRPR
jgi:dihydroorotase